MKEGILHFLYYTQGDYVRTPEGVGIVFEDEDQYQKNTISVPQKLIFNTNSNHPTTPTTNQFM